MLFSLPLRSSRFAVFLQHATMTAYQSKTVIKLTIYLLVLFGLLWQVYYISRQYFAYNYVTRVVIEHPDELQLPATVVCFTIQFESSLNQILTARIMLEKTATVDEFVDNIILGTSQSRGNMHKHLLQQMVCYVLAPNVTVAGTDRSFNQYWLYLALLNMKSIPQRKPMKGFLFLDKLRDHTFNYNSFQVFDIAADNSDNSYIYKYTHYERELLPPPYATNCCDYKTQTQFDSQQDCIDNCKIKKFIEQVNYLPDFTLISKPFDYPIFSPFGYAHNESLKGITDQIKRDCKQLCNMKDCYISTFVPYLSKRLTVNSANGQKQLIFSIAVPNQPKFTCIYTPIMHLTDYAIYLISCVSFWLGFSPLFALLWLHAIYFGQKRQKKLAPVFLKQSVW